MDNTKKSSTKKNKGRRNGNTLPSSPSAEMLKASVRAVVLALSAAFIFMLAGALIAFSGDDPTSSIQIIALVALYASALLSGFLSSKLGGRGVFLGGSVSAFIFVMLVLLVSLFIGKGASPFSPGQRAIIFLMIIPAVYLGALLGTYKRKKKRQNPYKHKR